MPIQGELAPGFWLVFWRELGWLRRRPFLLALTTLVPLVLSALLTAVFSTGLATRLPIGVLDLDSSELSRSVIRLVDATPDTAVAVRVAELAEGRNMILSGRILGLLMLPVNLERDVLAGRRPEVVFFYNTQMMTPGNLVLRGVNAAVPSAAAGVRLSLRTAQGQPVEAAEAALAPIPVQTNPLFNPTLNYVHFLLAALLPSLLQIVVVTASAYSAGLDVQTPHRLKILRRLGGGLWPALAGKMLPYTLLFLMVLGLPDAVLFGVYGLPLRGQGWLLLLFGFMGIGFPRLGMNAFAYGWGSILPGTWYLTARIDQTVRGTPLDLSWKPVLILLAFVGALTGLAVWRLQTMRVRSAAARPGGAPPVLSGAAS